MDNFFGLEYRKDKQCCPEVGSSPEHAIARWFQPRTCNCTLVPAQNMQLHLLSRNVSHSKICHRTRDKSIGRLKKVVLINDKHIGPNQNSRP